MISPALTCQHTRKWPSDQLTSFNALKMSASFSLSVLASWKLLVIVLPVRQHVLILLLALSTQGERNLWHLVEQWDLRFGMTAQQELDCQSRCGVQTWGQGPERQAHSIKTSTSSLDWSFGKYQDKGSFASSTQVIQDETSRLVHSKCVDQEWGEYAQESMLEESESKVIRNKEETREYPASNRGRAEGEWSGLLESDERDGKGSSNEQMVVKVIDE
ncbi:hypothetical protein OG21DRAFT_1526586 [Imleria badia]|nr:hypothetical protein OG21DRAFT_1526586 [Imleria badia]